MTSLFCATARSRPRFQTLRFIPILVILTYQPGCGLFSGYEYTQPDGTVVMYKSPAEVGAKAAVDHLKQNPPQGIGLTELLIALGSAVGAGGVAAWRQGKKIEEIRKHVNGGK